MRKKRVLIIEDRPGQRHALHDTLSLKGFEVYSAGTVAEARHLAELHWRQTDVAVLDMRLEDAEEPNITGADIGNEFRRKTGISPECLIFSAYAKVEYYKLALDLGVVAYLDKIKYSLEEVVRHVRTLALRKALSVENPDTIKQIIKIVTHGADRAHATRLFCQKIFAPELEACLDIPFCLILTVNNQSEYCAGNANLPKGAGKIYNTLQAIAQAQTTKTELIPLDLNLLSNETGTEITDDYKALQGAALLPIFASSEYQIALTLALLKEEEFSLAQFAAGQEVIPPGREPENPVELWKVLNQYLKSTVVEHLLTIFLEWSHIKNTLREISQICIWIGQEQDAIVRNTSSPLDNSVIQKLQAMAHDLTASGKLLKHIETPLNEMMEFEDLSARELLLEIWQDIQQAENLGESFKFEIDADCRIEAKENDLYVVFSRLLQWFVKRRISIPPDVESVIQVSCQSHNNTSTVVFTDRSNRLSSTIRKELFAPFSHAAMIPFANLPTKKNGQNPAENKEENYIPGQYLPLYISKMIVEVKYGGGILDNTDQLPGREDIGHQFVLSFTRLSQGNTD